MGSLLMLFGIITSVTAEFQPLCSRNESIQHHTCFSITLPKDQGTSNEKHYICLPTDILDVMPKTSCHGESCEDIHPSNFVLETPWLCCPQLSQPNPCRKINCPLPPINRKCVTYFEEMQCCPSYYCGKESRLQDHQDYCSNVKCSTLKAPKTCTEFHDPYDCCPKIDCVGGDKKRKCPFLHVDLAIYRRELLQEAEERPSWDRRNWQFERQRQLLFRWNESSESFQEVVEVRRCVGDLTCAQGQTCCPASGSLDGRPFSPYPKVPLGFCMPHASFRPGAAQGPGVKVVQEPPKGQKDLGDQDFPSGTQDTLLV